MKKKLTKIGEGESVYNHEVKYTEVKPCDEFYDTFSDEEILDIIQNLESSRAIDLKYTYYGIGAKQWNDYVNDVLSVSAEEELMEHAFDLIVKHIKKFDIDKINLVDLGVGNAAPVQKIINKLNDKNILNKYIGADISQEMFKYAEKNLKNIIVKNKRVMHRCDFERDNLYSALCKNKIGAKMNVCNILISLGGTICNHENISTVLENIYRSMDREDLFFFSNKILKKQNIIDSSNLFTPELLQMFTWILQYVGIDISCCDSSYHYDEERNMRYMIISLDKNYIINFKVLDKVRKVVLPRGSGIRIFNHTPVDYSQIFEWCENTGFTLSSINTTSNKQKTLVGFSLNVEEN